MNKLDLDYQNLLKDILENGVKKETRNGGTISVFGRQIRHDMKDGFPLLTTKKMPFKTIVTELLWFLRGDTNIKWLVDNNCHIWDGDCYKSYKSYKQSILESFDRLSNDPVIDAMPPRILSQEEFINKIKTDDGFAKKWGELGPIYGKQWRSWGIRNKINSETGEFFLGNQYIDQIFNLIKDLHENPDSRRLMVNAWNVGEINDMVLPPCHYGFQIYTRELSNDEIYKDFPEMLEILSLKWDVIKKQKYAEAAKLRDREKKYMEQYPQTKNLPKRAISLMWNQRSVDTFLGLPFNIASYGLLLEIIAEIVNMIPDQLIGNLGDVHLYSNHIEQAREQIGRDLTDEERYNIWFNNNYETGMERYFDPNNLPNFDDEYYEPTPKRTREPFPLPKLVFNPIFLANLEHKGFDEAINGQINFQIENYQSHSTIKAPLSN